MDDQDEGVLPLIPLKIPTSQGSEIEWNNLEKFPKLVSLGGARNRGNSLSRTSSKTVQMTRDRWDRTFRMLNSKVK